MASDRIHRGDLFWVEAEHAGGIVGGAPHPHVVVQEDLFNHSRIETVVVCALTTNLLRASEPGNVLLDPDEGGLARQSVVVVSQIASIQKASLGARIGALSQSRVEQVLQGLLFQQRSFMTR